MPFPGPSEAAEGSDRRRAADGRGARRAGRAGRAGRALVTWGGWEGHDPKCASALFVPELEGAGMTVEVCEGFERYADPEYMASVDLVVQCATAAQVSDEEFEGLSAAVAQGTGFAGWHGGLVAAFPDRPWYHLLTGGQFLAHFDDFVEHRIEIRPERAAHPVVAGIGSFDLVTEQYYMIVDPANDVLATSTIVDNSVAPWTAGVVMPQVWVRRWGQGRVFFSAPGHDLAVLRTPEVFEITRRGLLWAADSL
jgi:type 1 glutamine amidotransferase